MISSRHFMAQAPLGFRRVERIAKVGVWGALRTPARDKSANDSSNWRILAEENVVTSTSQHILHVLRHESAIPRPLPRVRDATPRATTILLTNRKLYWLVTEGRQASPWVLRKGNKFPHPANPPSRLGVLCDYDERRIATRKSSVAFFLLLLQERPPKFNVIYGTPAALCLRWPF
ncbi:hypothetical protein BDV24DRAFT_166773 [Aspergillus arachidicola]|uniref:Uncharacterized protein n=1 Tax=Aspergillus arachidicola TaxID=656916 RepID=A0A5N6XXN2_9EURO|nr:hypothetical protein BDV24DRAFT_166773 [Aspergillus arachidicola]